MDMELEMIQWETPRFNSSFSCFVRGCRKEAGHLTRLRHGKTVLQICLCNDCMHKSPDAILQGLIFNRKQNAH